LTTIDKVLTTEIAQELLKRTEALRKRGMNIPVKVHPSFKGCGTDPHWGRSNLVGIQGKDLLIQAPAKNRQPERVPADAVHLWSTYMHKDVLNIVEQVQKSYDENFGGTDMPIVRKVMAPPDGEAQTEADTDPAEPSPTVALPQPPPAGPPSIPFEQKYEQYRRLREELKNRAATEGVECLRKLHSDRSDAMQMVSMIEEDIIKLMTELAEFNVAIPSELLAAVGQPTVDTEPKPKAALPIPVQRVFAPKSAKTSWATGKAKEYQRQIEEFCKRRGNGWMPGKEIMDAIGEKAVPATILMPLVNDGFMERMGAKSQTVYRWKEGTAEGHGGTDFDKLFKKQ
jgi:hypothetical protein